MGHQHYSLCTLSYFNGCAYSAYSLDCGYKLWGLGSRCSIDDCGNSFFARIAEVSLREVDQGLIEAAQAMGCNRKQIIWHVLLPEALPGIVAGFTVTIVTMINSSAIAGAIGAGGLGDIAYRYGYQRFDMQIMVAVILVLIVLVMLVQATGDALAQQLDKRKV